jgi:hypothetical protein
MPGKEKIKKYTFMGTEIEVDFSKEYRLIAFSQNGGVEYKDFDMEKTLDMMSAQGADAKKVMDVVDYFMNDVKGSFALEAFAYNITPRRRLRNNLRAVGNSLSVMEQIEQIYR